MAAIVINILVSMGVLAGIVFTLINLPGNLVIVLIALGYAIYDGFIHINFITLALICALFLLGEVTEFIAGALGARRQKASFRATIAALIGAILGGIAGTAMFPIIGSVLGAAAGTFAAGYLAEYSIAGNTEQARRVAVGVMKGQIAGTFIKIVMAVGMAIMVLTKLPWSG